MPSFWVTVPRAPGQLGQRQEDRWTGDRARIPATGSGLTAPSPESSGFLDSVPPRFPRKQAGICKDAHTVRPLRSSRQSPFMVQQFQPCISWEPTRRRWNAHQRGARRPRSQTDPISYSLTLRPEQTLCFSNPQFLLTMTGLV